MERRKVSDSSAEGPAKNALLGFFTVSRAIFSWLYCGTFVLLVFIVYLQNSFPESYAFLRLFLLLHSLIESVIDQPIYFSPLILIVPLGYLYAVTSCLTLRSAIGVENKSGNMVFGLCSIYKIRSLFLTYEIDFCN